MTSDQKNKKSSMHCLLPVGDDESSPIDVGISSFDGSFANVDLEPNNWSSSFAAPLESNKLNVGVPLDIERPFAFLNIKNLSQCSSYFIHKMTFSNHTIKVLCAFDKWKDSLSAAEVADAVCTELMQQLNNQQPNQEQRLSCETVNLSDGGDGFLKAMTKPLQLTVEKMTVTGTSSHRWQVPSSSFPFQSNNIFQYHIYSLNLRSIGHTNCCRIWNQ
jgi:hypothetical protein